MTQKLDTTKAGFFDLPAELRVAVYEYYCTALLRETRCLEHMQYQGPQTAIAGVVKCDRNPAWSWHWRFVLKAQLISHQFRDEFVPLWASRSVFSRTARTAYQSLNGEKDGPTASIQAFCMESHDFMNRIGHLTRRNARGIRLRWELLGHDRCTDSTRHVCKRSYEYDATLNTLPRVAKEIQSCLERMDDVSPDFTIEIELETHLRVSHNDILYLRQVFTLQQNLVSTGAVDAAPWGISDSFMMRKFASCDGLTLMGPEQWRVFRPALELRLAEGSLIDRYDS